MQSIRDRLTMGAAWLAATRAIINLASFANTLLLARLLVPADFGLVALATTVTTIITSVTELSLTSALVQHADPSDDHFHTAWTLNFLRSALIAGIIAAMAVPVARLYSDPRLTAIMLVIAGTTVIGGMANPRMVVFSRNLVFRQEFVLGVSQRIAGLLAAVAVVLIWRSYWALVASILATQVTAVAVSYWLTPYRPRLRLNQSRELLSFSVWLTLAQVANTLNYRMDQLVIGYFLGNARLGLYTVGDSLAVLPTREATSPLAQTLFPGFVRLNADLPRLRQAYQRAQAFLCAVGLPVGLGFAVMAKPLIRLTMGEKWLPAAFVIEFLSCSFALQTLAAPLQPLAMALGETRRLFWRDVMFLAVRLPLVMIGLYLGGLDGVVYARCVSGMTINLLSMALTRRLLGLTLRAQVAVNTRTLLGGVAMMAAMYTVSLDFSGRTPALLVAMMSVMTISGAAVYVAVVYAAWRIAGQPAGPEREVSEILRRVLARRTPSLTTPGGL